MRTADFYYDLPEELIAQDPLLDRSSSRLMHLDKQTGEICHTDFKHIIDYLNPEDCLVINDTRVIPARLYGSKVGTDAGIEILLLKRRENNIWETLVKPGKKAKPGTKISFGDGLLIGEVLDIVEEGNRLIQFQYEGIFEEILDKLGEMPLPPYITHKLQDKERYQTVYAKNEGSAAAPTAGLHFTKELLEKIQMTIMQDGKQIYKGNATGEPGTKDLQNIVPLGTYTPAKESTLAVELTLDGDIGLEYCDLLTQIDWKFMVKEKVDSKDTPVTEIKPPKTGDTTNTGLWIFVVIGSMTVMGVVNVFRHRKETAEKQLEK